MNCAVYIRKSREDKNKPGHRLTVQREQLPEYAQAQGWDVIVYDDGHASAAKGKAADLRERERLRSDIVAGQVGVILVIELSRLSRDDTLEDYLAWLNLCAEKKVRLATMSRILDPQQHSDWMLLLMEGGFSSVEMKVLQGRMREGRQQALVEGKWLGGVPPPPYVYDKAARRPVIDEDRLLEMRRLWEMAETKSAKKIAEEIGRPEIFVRRAISDERLLIYQAKRVNPETGDIICCDWEAVMTGSQAELIRAGRRTRKTNIESRPFASLLAGLGVIVCGYCGRTVKSWRNSKIRKDGTRLNYYGCQTKNRKGVCTKSRMVPQDDLNSRILNNIFGTLSKINKLKEYWETDQGRKSPGAINEYSVTIEDLETRKQNIIEAISAGVIELDDAKDKVQEIKNNIATTKRKIADEIAAQETPPDWEALALIPAEFNHLPATEQRIFIAQAISEIKLYSTYASIKYPFPRDNKGKCNARVHLTGTGKGGKRYKR